MRIVFLWVSAAFIALFADTYASNEGVHHDADFIS